MFWMNKTNPMNDWLKATFSDLISISFSAINQNWVETSEENQNHMFWLIKYEYQTNAFIDYIFTDSKFEF